MSIAKGRQAYIMRHTPINERPLDEDEVRDNGIARGRAMFRARNGDRAAREAVELATAPDTDGSPPAA